MFKTNFFINPKRLVDGSQAGSVMGRLKYYIQLFPIRIGLWLGFQNKEYSYVHGDKSRVHLGKNCSTMNTIFNVISGQITIGDHTIFAHNCMVLTGTHNYFNGIRGELHVPPISETPVNGRDIHIGSGCFIGSGAIILGKVNIGNNVIVCAGAVVTKDLPDFAIAAGVPAKILHIQSNTFDVKN